MALRTPSGPAVEPTVGTGLVRELMNYAVTHGASAAALAARSGIDWDGLEDHDGRVPLPKFLALIEAGKELTGDPALALHFGAAVDVSEISIVGLLTRASETMIDALAQINRYGRLIIDAPPDGAELFQLQRRFGKRWLVDMRPRLAQIPEVTEISFVQLVCGTKRIGIGGWLRSVHVMHPAPTYAAEYERVFEAPVLFERDWNAMEFDESGVMRRVAVAPRYVFGILSEHADQLMRDLDESKTVRGKIERVLMPILHTGDVSMARIAEKLGVSKQALYRKLKAEGVTFEQLLQELRHKLALYYLGEKKASVNETAYLIGFSHPAAFSRAFKRWTGRPPGAARRD